MSTSNMNFPVRRFGCHGSLTDSQLRSGLAYTTHCFEEGGCQNKSTTSPKSLDQKYEPPKAEIRPILSQPLVYRPKGVGQRPDPLIEGLFGSISAIQLDSDHRIRIPNPTEMLQNLRLPAENANLRYTVRTPDGIVRRYMVNGSGERDFFGKDDPNAPSESIWKETTNFDDREQDDRSKDSIHVSAPNQFSLSLPQPEIYVRWLSSGQIGPAPPSPTPNEAQAAYIEFCTRQNEREYTRPMKSRGPWDDDEHNSFMHPCLPDCVYVLGEGENRFEVEKEMVRFYGFVL